MIEFNFLISRAKSRDVVCVFRCMFVRSKCSSSASLVAADQRGSVLPLCC